MIDVDDMYESWVDRVEEMPSPLREATRSTLMNLGLVGGEVENLYKGMDGDLTGEEDNSKSYVSKSPESKHYSSLHNKLGRRMHRKRTHAERFGNLIRTSLSIPIATVSPLTGILDGINEYQRKDKQE